MTSRRASERRATPRRARVSRTRRARPSWKYILEPGDVVLHRSFGRGSVEAVTDEHVRVRFEEVGEKVVSPDYLRVA